MVIFLSKNCLSFSHRITTIFNWVVSDGSELISIHSFLVGRPLDLIRHIKQNRFYFWIGITRSCGHLLLEISCQWWGLTPTSQFWHFVLSRLSWGQFAVSWSQNIDESSVYLPWLLNAVHLQGCKINHPICKLLLFQPTRDSPLTMHKSIFSIAVSKKMGPEILNWITKY